MVYITKEDREFLNIFCRLVVLEWIDGSKNKDNKDLKKFVTTEATYSDVLRMINKDFEETIFEANATQRAKIRDIERKLSPIARFGAAIMVGGPVFRAIGGTIAGATARAGTTGALGKMGAIAAKASAGGMAGPVGIITSLGLSFGVGLLSKVLFTAIRAAVDNCRKSCKGKFGSADHKSLRIKVCTYECKIKDIEKHMNNLKSELSKCGKTKNPYRCKQGINKKLADLQEMRFKDQLNLKKYKAQLQGKIAGRNETSLNKARPSAIV